MSLGKRLCQTCFFLSIQVQFEKKSELYSSDRYYFLTSCSKKNSSDGNDAGSVESGIDSFKQSVSGQQVSVGRVGGIDRGWVDTQGGVDANQAEEVEDENDFGKEIRVKSPTHIIGLNCQQHCAARCHVEEKHNLDLAFRNNSKIAAAHLHN